MSKAGFRVLDRLPALRLALPEATNLFLKLPLAEASKRKILWDNCARLYNLA